ncbi:MAG: hypothetical protein ABIJ97_08325 [Bacteroidota bacterium]
MKLTISLLLLLNLSFLNCHSQCSEWCYLDLNDPSCLSIDTSSIPDNIWQIGYIQKPYMDSTYSGLVIITDTINPYPINNYSKFTLHFIAGYDVMCGVMMLQGDYYVQTDSTNDYGNIEISLDNGFSWLDLKEDSLSSSFIWFSEQPVLTGNSHGWKYFDVMLSNLSSISNIQLDDMVLFRFTFRSDSISENLGGIMYDHLIMHGFVEGISDIHFKSIRSKIFPNPISDIFTIEFDNPDNELFELAIYDIKSKPVFNKNNNIRK